jgi:hypothetical protein
VKLSELKVNSARAEKGAWVGDIPEMPGVRFKVRGFNNADDKKIVTREMEKIPARRRRRGRINDDEQKAILNIRIKECLLTDWDGLIGDNDQPVPFSAEMLDTFLTDPDYAKLRDGIVWAISIVAEDDAEANEADAKN